MASILRSYNRFVLKSPLLAMSLTTGTTMGLGNIISQTVIEKRTIDTVDWGRVARFSAFGYIAAGPFLRYWYYGLEKYFTGVRFKPLKMMITDQLIAAPFINMAFLCYFPLANGKSISEATDRFYKDFPTVMKGNYCVWPAFQLTNFYFIPLQHRVLFVNICSVMWSTFLAYITK
ncbi:unnamed protein product [Rotaria magnacalcarata]|uniref:Mitochondrial inner membrane protein Mpv17 n=2 Tax=Rotaria magnacalcarata TaxID=392030 RepID=A0A816LJF6_9BILA|nr:unnamed protein product [Rotaria magnacalcarata]CAF1462823.1 unnamed protein product [Rotaria magnacalcarata]CAF1940695.1 unnamed protein product [Rotaria magnacalcarata]CAF2046068.1 unnamed protein product [Rotaria magnacalcarata]CAF2226388.1 unnamed protein product [Rotaria magnacalcarata]